jgi:hypothetical protein
MKLFLCDHSHLVIKLTATILTIRRFLTTFLGSQKQEFQFAKLEIVVPRLQATFPIDLVGPQTRGPNVAHQMHLRGPALSTRKFKN